MNAPAIPTGWTPHEARAVYKWLHELAEGVWATYDLPPPHPPVIDPRGPSVDHAQLEFPF